MIRQGDIRWYTFRHPDKTRPVLILTRNSIIVALNEVTIAPITSTIRDIPTEVFLSEHEGMSGQCAINCDHLQTVSKAKIGKLITKLEKIKMEAVKEALLFAFGFEI
jgi:mRNA interferase MazF